MTSPDRQRRVVGEIASGVIATALPSNSAAPTITGGSSVGSLLTCARGTWSGGALSYAYQWKLGGVSISGATSSTFASTTAGAHTCTVTATNGKGSASATSNSITEA